MYSFPSSAGSLSIETVISNSFFYFEEDDDEFSDYINRKIPDESFIVDIPSDIDSSALVSTISADSFDFSPKTHNLELYLHFDRELTAEEEESVFNDDELYDFIEHEFIPQFIQWFNNNTNINFPMHYDMSRYDFSGMRFDGSEFYSQLIDLASLDSVTSGKDYIAYSAVRRKFELTDKFELSV